MGWGVSLCLTCHPAREKGKPPTAKREKGKCPTLEFHPDLTTHTGRTYARTTRNETISRLSLHIPTSDFASGNLSIKLCKQVRSSLKANARYLFADRHNFQASDKPGTYESLSVLMGLSVQDEIENSMATARIFLAEV